jgi:hypothetical protein
MGQCGDGPGLALEPSHHVGVGGDLARQHLDRDVPIQVGVPGAVDLTHSPGPEHPEDLVPAEPRP